MSELVVATLSRCGVAVPRCKAGLRLEAKLLPWDGEPTVGRAATGSGRTLRWSATARGPADRIADNVAALDDFAGTVRPTDRRRPPPPALRRS